MIPTGATIPTPAKSRPILNSGPSNRFKRRHTGLATRISAAC
jgi:hypothetical protein